MVKVEARVWHKYRRWCLKCGQLFISETKKRQVCNKCLPNMKEVYKKSHTQGQGLRAIPEHNSQVSRASNPRLGSDTTLTPDRRKVSATSNPARGHDTASLTPCVSTSWREQLEVAAPFAYIPENKDQTEGRYKLT